MPFLAKFSKSPPRIADEAAGFGGKKQHMNQTINKQPRQSWEHIVAIVATLLILAFVSSCTKEYSSELLIKPPSDTTFYIVIKLPIR